MVFVGMIVVPKKEAFVSLLQNPRYSILLLLPQIKQSTYWRSNLLFGDWDNLLKTSAHENLTPIFGSSEYHI